MVEAPQTIEAGGQSDLGQRQIGLRHQLPGEEMAPGLRHSLRTGTEMSGEKAAQLALADAETGGEAWPVRVMPFGDDRHGAIDDAIGGCGGGRALRPAAQAGAETRHLRRSSAGIEGDVFGFRRLRRADRAAINAGGADGGEETPVKPRIARQQRAIADRWVKHLRESGSGVWHGAIMADRAVSRSPFSDMTAYSAVVKRSGDRLPFPAPPPHSARREW